MLIAISSELESKLMEKAAAAGVSVTDYVNRLLRFDVLELESHPVEADQEDAEYEEIRTSVI